MDENHDLESERASTPEEKAVEHRTHGAVWIAAALILALGIAASVWLASRGRGEGTASRESQGRAQEPGGYGEQGAETHEVKLSPEDQKRWGIRVESAAKRVLCPTFEVPARVKFNEEKVVHVGSPLRGRVVDVKVRLGDEVRKGDELLVVESPDLGEAQVDYLAKAAAAKAAEPKVELAKALFERARELQKGDRIVSRTEVDRREMEYRDAEAALVSARSALDASLQRLDLLGMSKESIESLQNGGRARAHLTIRSPLAAHVMEREVTLGELVGPERESLMVLADPCSLWVIADVPEGRLHEVEKGARVLVRPAAAASERLEGTVTYVSPVVHRDTRAGEVRVEVPQSERRLVPGMFVRAEITAAVRGGMETPLVVVPEGALQTIAGKHALFVPVPDEENTFRRRAVGVGRPVGGFVPVYSGLEAGESFVAAGTFILKAELESGSAQPDR
jgi:cobalt-zinc-cadmium efflux system membrane fusion protein